MSEITYSALVDQPKIFLAMKGLKPDDFNALLSRFQFAYQDSQSAAGKVPVERRCRTGKLAMIQDKPFFVLFHYLKTYPFQ